MSEDLPIDDFLKLSKVEAQEECRRLLSEGKKALVEYRIREFTRVNGEFLFETGVVSDHELKNGNIQFLNAAPQGVFGCSLLAIGLGLVMYAFSMDTSVSVTVSDFGADLLSGLNLPGVGRVSNAELMARQLMTHVLGCAILICSAVFLSKKTN